MTDIPKTMRALLYTEPKKHSIVEVPVPELRENDVLV
jgi:D-arabinitol dehydrogenase (NADP+)